MGDNRARRVEFWRMGADPVPSAGMATLAREFEHDGWDGLAVGEAHGILPDPYAVQALAASATARLKLGTAVAVPLRHPMLAADAIATLQGISGGRACLFFGWWALSCDPDGTIRTSLEHHLVSGGVTLIQRSLPIPWSSTSSNPTVSVQNALACSWSLTETCIITWLAVDHVH